MNKIIEDKYNDLVENKLITFDFKQRDLLNNIYSTWLESKKFNFFSNLKKNQGIYIFGPVGVGKTFIINLFLQHIASSKKYHFNHFMINLHALYK